MSTAIKAVSMASTATVPQERTRTILIVDNDEDILIDLERVLEDVGYVTETAINYDQALKLLAQNAFDLLVLDDYLSDRDSIQVIVDLRRADLLPLVVVTYHQCPTRDLQSRLRWLGVSALIQKQAHSQLTEIVHSLFNGHKTHSTCKPMTALPSFWGDCT
jgi:DNA-binding response OmpR family regulator